MNGRLFLTMIDGIYVFMTPKIVRKYAETRMFIYTYKARQVQTS